MAVSSTERLRDELTRVGHRGGHVRDFSLAAARVLARAVPFDGFCLVTMDPATMLPTGEVVENGLPPEATRRMAAIEISGADFNSFGALGTLPRAGREPERGHQRRARPKPSPSRTERPARARR